MNSEEVNSSSDENDPLISVIYMYNENSFDVNIWFVCCIQFFTDTNLSPVGSLDSGFGNEFSHQIDKVFRMSIKQLRHQKGKITHS